MWLFLFVLVLGGVPRQGRSFGALAFQPTATNAWTAVTLNQSLPDPRYACSMTSFNNEDIIVFGGKDNVDMLLSDTWWYSLDANVWTDLTGTVPLTTSPQARHETPLVPMNSSTALLFGGYGVDVSPTGGILYTSDDDDYNGLATLLDDLWLFTFTPPSSTGAAPLAHWQELHPSNAGPSARFGHAAAALLGSFVLFGGENNNTLFSDVWLFNLTTLLWSQLQQTGLSDGAPPRGGASFCALSSSSMLISGGLFQTQSSLDGSYDDTWVMTLSASLNVSWFEYEGVSPGVRLGSLACQPRPDGSLWGTLFGGVPTNSYTATDSTWFLSLTDISDPSAMTWTSTTLVPSWNYQINGPVARRAAGMASASSAGYPFFFLFGGLNPQTAMNELWLTQSGAVYTSFDPLSTIAFTLVGSWTQQSPTATIGVIGLDATAAELYLSCWSLDTSTAIWKREPVLNGPSTRNFPFFVQVHPSMSLLFGGLDSSTKEVFSVRVSYL